MGNDDWIPAFAGMNESFLRHLAEMLIRWWYGLMAASGFAFGIFANKRPLGSGILVHPLVLFFILVAAALLVLRIARARPVPEIIPDRALVYGCSAGLAAFLIGNYISVFVLAVR